MVVRYVIAILVATIHLSTCVAERPGRWDPYPICKQCRSPELMEAPGVGFDLALSYGTAAIRFQNGSINFVGQVNGDYAFQSLWERLSDWNSRPHEPKNRWEVIRRDLERARRRLNKIRGLPATDDVETIAKMLIKLREVVEMTLGDKIDAAVVASPNLPGLVTEDLDDAMEYAGIKRLKAYNYQEHISETSAGYAGLGKGLCSKPEDIEACEDEEVYMPERLVLSISFTNTVLSFAFTQLADAHRGYEWISRYHLDLGLDASNQYRNKTTYWTEVTQKIRNFAIYPDIIDHVQLLGETATNEHFLQALEDAFMDYGLPQPVIALNASERYDPLSLAAIGAAEFAKRFQVMTWDCMEPARCHQDQKMAGKPVGDL